MARGRAGKAGRKRAGPAADAPGAAAAERPGGEAGAAQAAGAQGAADAADAPRDAAGAEPPQDAEAGGPLTAGDSGGPPRFSVAAILGRVPRRVLAGLILVGAGLGYGLPIVLHRYDHDLVYVGFAFFLTGLLAAYEYFSA